MAKKVIVVDDSITIRQQLREALATAGYEVIEASDGYEALRSINEHVDTAMVICDVNMPNMSGLEMLAAVKAVPRNAALPVVMLTTEGDPMLVRAAKASGAKGWIAKPLKPELLLATVRKLAGAA